MSSRDIVDRLCRHSEFRSGGDFTSPYEVQLRASGNILAQANAPTPSDGLFTPVTAAQPFFDDVRLSFTPAAVTPEPRV